MCARMGFLTLARKGEAPQAAPAPALFGRFRDRNILLLHRHCIIVHGIVVVVKVKLVLGVDLGRLIVGCELVAARALSGGAAREKVPVAIILLRRAPPRVSAVSGAVAHEGARAHTACGRSDARASWPRACPGVQ